MFGTRKLGKTSEQRRALLRQQVTDLLANGKMENIAFSGDTLFRMSIGRTDFELGNYDDIIVSLQSLPKHMPLDTTILPGHGPQTTLGEEVQCNPYFK